MKKQRYTADNTYIDFAQGWGSQPGNYPQQQSVGRGHDYQLEFGHGAGNHSPWNGEVWRHDAGMMSYRHRPQKQDRFHTTPGYYNNQWF